MPSGISQGWIGAAAGPIAQLLGTRLRTDVLEVAEHAVPTRLATEEGLLDRELRALEESGRGTAVVDPREHAREGPTESCVVSDGEHSPEPVEEARQQIGP